ncbi:MAG: 8-oxo-dGTP diphosphatase [Myxococcota bacterium]|jgi:8-oxo-dGTP diphosphatase
MKIIRVVAGAIIKDGLLLAALRGPGMSQAGLWELPGGKVEPGEDDRSALARELHEELGITVAVGDFIASHDHAYPGKTVRLVAYACRIIDGALAVTEHAEIRWVSAGAIDGLTWAPADLPLLIATRPLLTAPPMA